MSRPDAQRPKPGGGDGAADQPAEVAPDGTMEEKDPQRMIERLQGELQEANDRYVRAVADLDNTRKRLQRDKDAFAQFAHEGIIRQLLPIIDGLDQALVAVDKQSDPQAIIKGVHLIYRQLLGLLEKEGVKRIHAVNMPFDPHRHEAVGQVDTEDGKQDGKVVEEVQVGYTMRDRVLRPAMVKVAKRNDRNTPDNEIM